MKNYWSKLIFILVLSNSFLSASAQTYGSSSNLKVEPLTDRVVPFKLSEKGVVREVEWGTDLAWIHEANLRRCVLFMGKDNVAVARASFQPTYALVDGDLQQPQKDSINIRLNLLKFCKPDVKLMLNCDHPHVDRYYSGKATNWAKLIDLTTKYFQEAGYNVVSVAPFNEPDYTATGQGNMTDFYNICVELRKNERFDTIRLCGGNTLNTDKALTWYNQLKSVLDEGNTHQLAGSFDNFAKFFTTVRNDGKHATDDEMHNVMEAMVGIEYGLQTGIWWGAAEYARGEFCKASHGERLGYAEHRNNWTAASVYRAPDGQIQAFGGTSERQATATSYKFISKDRDVFFDGHGPQREYVINLPGGTGYQQGQTGAECVVNITWGDDVRPVIDGTYMLVNKYKKSNVLDIVNGKPQINSFNKSYKSQQWEVHPVDPLRTSDFSHIVITSASSRQALDVANFSLEDNAEVMLYTDNYNVNQHWYLEYAGDGWFYIRNRHSSHCLELYGNGLVQGVKDGNEGQLWRFVPTGTRPKIRDYQAPTGLQAQARPSSVLLTWEPCDGSTPTYTILRSETADGDYETIGRNISETSFVDNKVEAGKTYFYTVKMVDMFYNMTTPSNVASAAATGKNTMVARYDFEENTRDTTENINHAAVLNATYAEGYTGSYSIDLNGSTDFIQLPTEVANHKDITISAWIYWEGGNEWQRIFDFGNGEDEYMFLTVRSNENNKVRFAIKNGGEEQILNGKSLSTSKNQWVHLAITMGQDSVSLYQNGEWVASTKDITIRPTDFKPFMNYIGRSQYSADPMFSGRIDDFRIFNYELNANEIKSLVEDPSCICEPTRKEIGITFGSLPANQELTINLNVERQTDNVHLQIFNTQGLLVRNVNTTVDNTIHVDVADLPSGLYILKATSGKEFGSKKFSIQH